jgi:hypothetical protein
MLVYVWDMSKDQFSIGRMDIGDLCIFVRICRFSVCEFYTVGSRGFFGHYLIVYVVLLDFV